MGLDAFHRIRVLRLDTADEPRGSNSIRAVRLDQSLDGHPESPQVQFHIQLR